VQQCIELTGTNRSIGLIVLITSMPISGISGQSSVIRWLSLRLDLKKQTSLLQFRELESVSVIFPITDL
jgi:hypothetical protein